MSSKAQSAIILKAVGRTAEANEFIFLKEHLVQTDELAYFAFQANPYNQYAAHPRPWEVMEALRMAGGNDASVGMKLNAETEQI